MNESVANSLAQLRDIHDPLLPGLWPLAIGWWILAIVTAILIGIVGWRSYGAWKRRQPYRQLKRMIHELIAMRHSDQLDSTAFVNEVNFVLKTFIVDVEGNHEASTLHGDEWLRVLGDRFNDRRFSEGSGRVLGDARFSSPYVSDQGLEELVRAATRHMRPQKAETASSA